ncbi:peptidase [Streptomyces sp. R302]|uniref:peptidase n=1 Tax=unclassified Streptomyces TaxID=2593676 RepID=UPI00145F461E|nr:peptidase [Streptomyces sp. R301]NML82899.1 peptidase [Streptomyces sp. R302]
MSKEPNRRRTAAALTAAVAVWAPAGLAAAPAAHADVVDVKYACETEIGDRSAVSPVDITAERKGDAYTITMTFDKGVSDSPVELPKGVMTPRAELVLGGDDRGTLQVKGTPNPAAVPAFTPVRIGTLTGTYTPKANGTVTFTAGLLTVHALGMDAAVCRPANTPGPSLTLTVTGLRETEDEETGEEEGAAEEGLPGGELPKTGGLSTTAALATLGGTVLLGGTGALLWLTRRPRPARP